MYYFCYDKFQYIEHEEMLNFADELYTKLRVFFYFYSGQVLLYV